VSHTLIAPTSLEGRPETRDQRLTRLVAEISIHVQQQLHDGVVWRRWQTADERLAPFADLGDLIGAWQDGADDSVRAGLGALVSLGSARGDDDELAAMTALVLMAGGVYRMAHDLDDVCDPEDVVVTMWLEIRVAEPTIGPWVGRHLVQRCRQRLLRERGAKQTSPVVVHLRNVGAQEPVIPGEDETPFHEFVDLLTWAERRGVMNESDVALLAELLDEERAGATRTEALVRAGARRGLTDRTVRRRERRALEALRRAVPAYLAATA
jgi:hypothetical protein